MMGTRHVHCITRGDSEERVKIKDLSAQSKLPCARGRNSDAQPDVGTAEDEDDAVESDTSQGRDECLCG